MWLACAILARLCRKAIKELKEGRRIHQTTTRVRTRFYVNNIDMALGGQIVHGNIDIHRKV